jgi:cysteine desulfuration protein SufE
VPDSDIIQIQRDLIADFAVFDDWLDRYQYLIDLGRQLPPFPDSRKTDANRVHGCQAQVWLHCRESGGRLVIQAISDAAIVSGLIALLIRVYSNQRPQLVLDTPPIFIEEIGLGAYLSPTRSNGLHVMLNTIMRNAAGLREVTREFLKAGPEC